MNAKAVATALRVLASAAERELLVDRPTCLDVYGRTLEPVEVRWLLDGMPDATLAHIPDASAFAEDMQLVGTLVGRTVRVLLVSRKQPGLLGDVAMQLAARARAAFAEAAR